MGEVTANPNNILAVRIMSCSSGSTPKDTGDIICRCRCLGIGRMGVLIRNAHHPAVCERPGSGG